MDEIDFPTKRESDLTALAQVMGANRMRYGWPPKDLAPGITMVSRRHHKRDPKTQEPSETRVYLAPQIEDSRLYYAHLNERNRRPEDAKNCPRCNGATFVRNGELVPGQFGFGLPLRCPRWVAGEGCVNRDHMGIDR